MIQSEADEYEQLDESDPNYAEKHNLLLEAFTDMDKDACYTGINNGMFMGTLTGPDIRVESMRITAYTPGPSRYMTFEGFKTNLENKLDDTKRKLNEAGSKLNEAYKAYNRVKAKYSLLASAKYKNTEIIAAKIADAKDALDSVSTKYTNAVRSQIEAEVAYNSWKGKQSNKESFKISDVPDKLYAEVYAAYSEAVNVYNAACTAFDKVVVAEKAPEPELIPAEYQIDSIETDTIAYM